MELVIFPEKRMALAFSDYLRSIGIDNALEARTDGHAIVLANAADYAQARQEVEDFINRPQEPRYWQASWQSGKTQAAPVYGAGPGSGVSGFLARGGPVTKVVALLCLLIYAGLWLVPDAVFAALRYPSALTMAAIGPEWWRLVTPALLHFSALHIVFNLLWWWELGGIVERGQSGARLMAVALVIALVSNAAQGLEYGSRFGGLSGVIYGLVGYLWIYPLLNPAAGFRLRREILWFMLGWLALGYTGLLDAIFGSISNIGHLSGLLAGMALGAAVGVVNRGQASRTIH